MGLREKNIAEQEVPLWQGEHVKNGQNKIHTAIPTLLNGKAHLDIMCFATMARLFVLGIVLGLQYLYISGLPNTYYGYCYFPNTCICQYRQPETS